MNHDKNRFLSFNGTREKVVLILDIVQSGTDPAVCSTMVGGGTISKEHYTANSYPHISNVRSLKKTVLAS